MSTAKSVVYEKAYAFSILIVNCTRSLSENKKEYILSKQLLRSGTSIGAISKADFSHKISISYKESLESKYWIDLLCDTGYIDKESHNHLYCLADEISRILFSILKTTRINTSGK